MTLFCVLEQLRAGAARVSRLIERRSLKCPELV